MNESSRREEDRNESDYCDADDSDAQNDGMYQRNETEGVNQDPSEVSGSENDFRSSGSDEDSPHDDEYVDDEGDVQGGDYYASDSEEEGCYERERYSNSKEQDTLFYRDSTNNDPN